MIDEPIVPAVTKVLFSREARKELYEGLSIAAEAVSCTLGPKGKTVLIQKVNEAPLVTKDGVTVSRSIKLKDPIKRMGAELIREAAIRTNDVAGDGTTTATVLTHAMVKEGLKLLEAGYSAQLLCKGITHATEFVVEELKERSKQLTTSEEIAQVGTISANGDSNIGDLIAKAMNSVGRDGIITVEDAKGMATSLSIVEGMQFDRGYLSPYFVTNNERMCAAYQDAYVLITNKKLTTIRELVPILEKVVRAQKPLVIIAEDVEGEALQGLVLNRVKSNLAVVAIKAPGYGGHRDELLSDLCVLTGATLVSSTTGVSLDKLDLAQLGTCKKVLVDAKSTIVVGTGTTKEQIEKHANDLRLQLEDITLTANDIVKLKTRIAKLASGVAVIKVGGATEVEMIERKYRIEDALNATRAASEEGIVPGGGMALLRASEKLISTPGWADDRDVYVGWDIVIKACKAPLIRIVQNAGLSPDVVINELRQQIHQNLDIGYNAANNTYCDLISAGVIDPVKVTRTALQHAASVAITFLSLDAVIYEELDK